MSGKHRNILVVDGDASVQDALLRSVQGTATVRSCSDVATASDEMRADQAQIVFLGENLPDGTNVEVARAFTKEFPRSACIIVSSNRDEKSLLDALHAGAKDFVTKPLSHAAIEAALSRCDRWNAQKNRYFDDATLHASRLELELPSTAAALLPAIDAVVELARGFLNDRDLKGLEVALNEALRNAYEHGNLGVTYEEKAALCESGDFEAELEKRSKEAVAAGKKIFLTAQLEPACLRCTVTDEGLGFDPEALPDSFADSAASLCSNGRGVAMIRRYFTRVQYQKGGTQVILEKKLR